MNKLRLGVIGVGSVVREIYQHLYFHSDYSHLLDVVAVADPNDAAREWFCNAFGIPKDRRFADYREMLTSQSLDVVQVNTPDHMHAQPTVAAFNAGLDVLVPKPTAATVQDAHAMMAAAERTGRLMAVDFHKREDPRIKTAIAQFQQNRYGRLQSGVWYMLDKLMVADPNHTPPFFASPDFPEKNTPISFLTVHMCDALLQIVRLLPVEVRVTGYSHKLPTLEPISVHGFDLCDTEIRLENGAVVHIITGWHLPNSAHSITVQSGRLICTDGMLDLNLDQPGYHELHPDGIVEVNPLFRAFDADGLVSGYGMSSPGKMYQRFLSNRRGELDETIKARMMSPLELGFYTTLVCEGAEKSLRDGEQIQDGVTAGMPIDLHRLCAEVLGQETAERSLQF